MHSITFSLCWSLSGLILMSFLLRIVERMKSFIRDWRRDIDDTYSTLCRRLPVKFREESGC